MYIKVWLLCGWKTHYEYIAVKGVLIHLQSQTYLKPISEAMQNGLQQFLWSYEMLRTVIIHKLNVYEWYQQNQLNPNRIKTEPGMWLVIGDTSGERNESENKKFRYLTTSNGNLNCLFVFIGRLQFTYNWRKMASSVIIHHRKRGSSYA